MSFPPDVMIQWSSQGDLLAVAGMERGVLPLDPSGLHPVRNAIVKFYNVRGEHIYTLDTPAQVTHNGLIVGCIDRGSYRHCSARLHVAQEEEQVDW